MNQPIRIASGAKVGWEVYRLKKDAVARAEAARAHALELRKQGYDFGFLVPGTVNKVRDGWEVIIP
jgi:hypothetical protein